MDFKASNMENFIKSIAVLVLVFCAGCEMFASVDRGLYQASTKMTQTDNITGDKVLGFKDRATQIATANKVAEKTLRKYDENGRLYNDKFDPVAYRRIADIFSRIMEVSHMKSETWTPVLLPDNVFNAYTNGGTYFFVYSGLEKQLVDDDELANVIAHELAHVSANHVFENSDQKNVSILLGDKSAKRDNYNKAFTHEAEKEADKIAILYCALAGYDPYAASRLWARVAAEKGSMATIVQDHPINAERAENTKAIADIVSIYYKKSEQNKNHEAILQKNLLWEKKNIDYSKASGQGGGLMSFLDAAAGAFQKHYQAKTEESRQKTRAIIVKSIDDSMVILDSRPEGNNLWAIYVQYKGYQPVAELSIRGIFTKKSGEKISIVKASNLTIGAWQKFKVVFEKDGLDAYSLDRSRQQFTVDNGKYL